MNSSRILVLSTNNEFPRFVACRDCDGDGYVYAYGNNPSERPYRVSCDTCSGTGVLWRESHSGMVPGSFAEAPRPEVKPTPLFSRRSQSRRPAVAPPVAAGHLEIIADVFTVVLGLAVLMLIALVLMVIA